MKKVKKQFVSFFILSSILTLSLLPATSCLADESITGVMRRALNFSNLPGSGDDVDAEVKTTAIVGKIINAFLSIFAVLFFLLMVYDGYKWLAAMGREEEVTKAKDVIRSAIIGLAIVMSAYAISWFVVSRIQAATAA